MPALRWSSLLLLLLGAGTAQEEPVPVEQEPHHRVVLKNDFVEVMRVTLSPGERTLYHTHSHDGAAVELSTGSITRQKVGAAEDPPVSIRPGDLSMTTVNSCDVPANLPKSRPGRSRRRIQAPARTAGPWILGAKLRNIPITGPNS